MAAMSEDGAALVRIGEVSLWILKADFQFPHFSWGDGVIPDLRPLDAVFAHHWACGLTFTYIDVGAKYGLSAITVARYIQACGHRNPVIAFEPGAAADLIGRNLAVNHLESTVILELTAVSDGCGETVIYSEPDHPEDNHIIRRNIDRHFDTRTVPTVSLDAYAELKGILAPLVVKVDTQGAEWEVWKGMQRLVQSRPVTLMTEFTPWTFEGRAQPTQFLRELAEHFHIVDINRKNMAGSFEETAETPAAFHVITAELFDAFTQSVAESSSGWTDLLCIPRLLPQSEDLLAAVTAQ